MKTAICKDCGKTFELPSCIMINGVKRQVNKNRKRCFECMPHCHDKIVKTQLVQCEHCHTPFQKKKWDAERHEKHFCSNQCRLEHLSINPISDTTAYYSIKTVAQLLDEGNTRRDIQGIITRKSRVWNRALRSLSCIVCGYTKHTQLAHVKAIHDFSDGATIGEINAKDNIIPLCPNHHWEYDHDLLDLADKTKINEWLKIRKEMLKPHDLLFTFGKPTP